MIYQLQGFSQMNDIIKVIIKDTELKVNFTDESRYYFRLVLNILTNNSFKHSGENSIVSVEVNICDSKLEILVEDSGRGIVDYIDRGCKRGTYSESGRGLAIVKGLCSSVEFNDTGSRASLPI